MHLQPFRVVHFVQILNEPDTEDGDVETRCWEQRIVMNVEYDRAVQAGTNLRGALV